MKRLTADSDNGTAYYPYCFRDDTCGGMGIEDCSTCDFIDQVCQRLAEYERTGLEPEEVMMALQINKNLVEQLERQWIPVEERLPEIGEPVVITLRDKGVTVGTWYGHRWGTALRYSADVIAWMPLPPPYRPENLREAGEDAAQGGLMPGA